MQRKIILTLLCIVLIWLGYRTEIDLGRCTDNNGNGKIYNGDEYYNYICYDGHVNANENDIVMTICVLNPFNNYCDDIVLRFDKVILVDKKGENYDSRS